ncbi:DUF4176 domain-containing protein [Bacillus cereus]|uniref:DUF4176 domain-containing protein n=1 Tax=Bacillus cereus TaxID=1396 RepID=UPI003D05223F
MKLLRSFLIFTLVVLLSACNTATKVTKVQKMVYGRKQMDSETKRTWDYVCCYFPHGNISSEYNFFLNHEDISSVLHLGFINETELEFQKLFKKEVEEKR